MADDEQKGTQGAQPQEQTGDQPQAQPPAEEPQAQPHVEVPPAEPPAEEPQAEPPAEEPQAEPKVETPTAPEQAEAPVATPTDEPAATPEEGTPAGEAVEAIAEGEEKPKKKPSKRSKKAKAEAEPEVAEGDVVIETIDEKTDRKITYTIKPLFGKYPFTGVVVTNPGLQRYININPVSVPHTGARHANRPFAKQHVNIVERLINGMMRTEWGTGEKAKMYRVVEEAFDIINTRTKQNPIQVFVDALCNSAPKEEVTRLRYGGINVPKAVDVSASRRLDIALRNICRGTINSSHNNKKHLKQCLADEIILASKREINSFAVGKKEELERIAASAR